MPRSDSPQNLWWGSNQSEPDDGRVVGLFRCEGMQPGCPATASVPAALAPSASWPCIILYDRHIEKSGGSTLSLLMQRLEEQQECMYWGYHVTPSRWRSAMRALHMLNGTEGAMPRLCIDAHHGGTLGGSNYLQQLGQLRESFKRRSVPCRVLRTTRVREPLSYYISFYLWAVRPKGRPGQMARLGDEGFLRWANATPNLQSNVLIHPSATQTAVNMPEKRLASMAYEHLRPGASVRDIQKLVAPILAEIDLVAPLERFDEALLLIAEYLGLRHVQYVRNDPACPFVKGRPARVSLDDGDACSTFATATKRCEGLVKRCAPELREACEDVVRRVAPADRWLHRSVRRKFEARLTKLGAPFEQRVRAFRAASLGVWRGGPPAKPRCRFQRRPPGGSGLKWELPNFMTHPCTPAPQAVGEAAWHDRGFVRQAAIVPVTDAAQLI